MADISFPLRISPGMRLSENRKRMFDENVSVLNERMKQSGLVGRHVLAPAIEQFRATTTHMGWLDWSMDYFMSGASKAKTLNALVLCHIASSAEGREYLERTGELGQVDGGSQYLRTNLVAEVRRTMLQNAQVDGEQVLLTLPGTAIHLRLTAGWFKGQGLITPDETAVLLQARHVAGLLGKEFEQAEMYDLAGDAYGAAEKYESAAYVYMLSKSYAKAAEAYNSARNYRMAANAYREAGLPERAAVADVMAGSAEATQAPADNHQAAEVYGTAAQLDSEVGPVVTPDAAPLGAARILASEEQHDETPRIDEGIENSAGEAACLKAAGADETGELYGNDAEGYERAAGIHEHDQKYDEAAEAFRNAGQEHEKCGVYGRAAGCYERAAEIYEVNRRNVEAVEARLNAAHAYGKSGLYGPAAGSYEKAAWNYKADAKHDAADEAFCKAAQAYEESGSLEKAAKAYANGQMYREAADAYKDLGMLQEAAQFCCMEASRWRWFRGYGDPSVEVMWYVRAAEYYRETGMERKKTEAIQNAVDAWCEVGKYRAAAKLCEEQGWSDKAARYYRTAGPIVQEDADSGKADGTYKGWKVPSRLDDPKANARRILGVAENASKRDITRAYHKLARTCHPDKLMTRGASPSEIADATEFTKKITVAHALLQE